MVRLPHAEGLLENVLISTWFVVIMSWSGILYFLKCSCSLLTFQRLALLSSAAEGCSTIHAADLPNSASEPVLQLRVMGDFSISSGPSDDEDGAFCAVN